MENNGNEQFFSMSLAYLEIGKIASNTQESELKKDTDFQNAVAYQLYHSIELFLKYAISTKQQKVPHIHDFTQLIGIYTRLFPGPEYQFENPFDFSDYKSSEYNIGEKEKAEDHLSQFKPSILDQHIRYPNDDKTGEYSFSIAGGFFDLMKTRLLDDKRYTLCYS